MQANNKDRHRRQEASSRKLKLLSLLNLLLHIAIAVVSFNAGFYASGTCLEQDEDRLHQELVCCDQLLLRPKKTRGKSKRSSNITTTGAAADDDCDCISSTQSRYHKDQFVATADDGRRSPLLGGTAPPPPRVFPESVRGFIQAATRVNRSDFLSAFDVGFPWQAERDNDSTDIVLLYTSYTSLPTRKVRYTDGLIPLYSLQDATENCNIVKVVSIEPQQAKVCMAVMGLRDSYHVHKFMRRPDPLPKNTGRKQLSKGDEFRYSSRNLLITGLSMDWPVRLLVYRRFLMDYLQKMPATLEKLKPIAAEAAGTGNTVIVMVCNFGQSELLMNFACAARSRNLDVSNILIFATDKQTVSIVESLGLHVFDVQDAFGSLPTESSQIFGDNTFGVIAMAKWYVVHLVNFLRYNVLFQDVDVVWYQDLLPVFHSNKDLLAFDIVFSDDGSRLDRETPYSANTGLYFVRHNERTELAFSILARLNDLVKESRNDQYSLNGILGEFASWLGLKIKVLSRDGPIGKFLPNGFHYHMRPMLMKNIMTGLVKPYIFHMSWTDNKINKLKFFQQMGEWYVYDRCIGKSISEINVTKNFISTKCCSMQPLLQCHFHDKPSKYPCNDSPNLDKGGNLSFW